MAIPESNLKTWSHQGSLTQSSTTFNLIKNILESSNNPIASKRFDIFLQGSYGNDTNIYCESDIDIVIMLTETFEKDLSRLAPIQQQAFNLAYSSANYYQSDFKQDVFNILKAKFGKDVSIGEKAITIEANGNRRKVDVIVANQFRYYSQFMSKTQEEYIEGISFYKKSGGQIINYPKQHSKNLTVKHQATSSGFKPIIRIFKNLRSKLVEQGFLEKDAAPSYFLEGLLYNVPNKEFSGSSLHNRVVNIFNWINNADRQKFICANQQYYLLWENSPVSWRAEKCEAFLSAFAKFWKQY